jgi:hypothetical protein
VQADQGERRRPAFYALAEGGWRDYVTLLHPPYTAWHLATVAVGAALAPRLDLARLALTLLAFLLAVGVAAHAFDELHGRPLRTRIPDRGLRTLAWSSLAGATAIGVAGVVVVGPLVGVLALLGAAAVPAYNLELWGGRLHTDAAFALLWGGFPVLAGFVGQTGAIRPATVIGVLAGAALAGAQRALSTHVRRARRMLPSEAVTPAVQAGVDAAERALLLLTATVVLLAVAACLARA